jgi:UDP-N-acetylmuramoyl-tripeptide--D-alanyl-D-alanine ligase
VDQLITIGDGAEMIAEGARVAGMEKVLSARSTGEAAKLLGEIAEPGDLILIKGSRAARTEEVIKHFGSQNSAFVISP